MIDSLDTLVIQLARFGDFLQSTPLLARIRKARPDGRLAVMVDSGLEPLARKNPHVDQVIPVDLSGLRSLACGPEPVDRMMDGAWTLLAGLKPFTTRRIINLNTSRISALIGRLIRCETWDGPSLAADREGLDRPLWSEFIMALMGERPLIRFNLVDLYQAYVPGPSAEPLTYPVSVEARARGLGLLSPRTAGPRIGFQMGSKNELRQWPPELFADLARRLVAHDRAQVVLLGTREERGLAGPVVRTVSDLKAGGQGSTADASTSGGVVDLMGRTTIDELAGVLAGLDLLVTTDTGAMHLAAAVGTPILALFIGPAFGHETGPYGPGYVVVQTALACGPCRESAGCRNPRCRDLIQPELVAEAARRIVQHGSFQGFPDPGAHVQILVSEMDSFGVRFRPLTPRPFTRAEAAALAWREAGRGLLNPSYRMDEADLARERTFFGPVLAPCPGRNERVEKEAGPFPSLSRVQALLVRRGMAFQAQRLEKDWRTVFGLLSDGLWPTAPEHHFQSIGNRL
jgi:ADP-heptose:LPS heptosyltransferase